MAVRISLIFVLIGLVAIQAVVAKRQVVRKRGRCPAASKNPGICIFQPDVNCLNDYGCPGRRKCCPEGCGRVCKMPCRPIRCSTRCREFVKDKRGCPTCRCKVPLCPRVKCKKYCREFVKDKNGCRTCRCVVTKSGTCPAASKFPGPCRFFPGVNCLGDFACPGRRKCCREGCGRVCKMPCPLRRCYRLCKEYVKDKRGCSTCRCKVPACPVYKCISNCQIYLKDKNGCPTCQCAGATKPGVCPKYLPRYCIQFDNKCKADSECRDNQKCCRVSCGTWCKTPITKLLPPIKCKPGEKKIRCFANPCHHAKCGHPGARCAPNYCDQCTAEFYDQNGNRVCHKKSG